MKKNIRRCTILFSFLCCISSGAFAQNPWNGKVILQGFWYNYSNKNYPLGWSNYLAALAPRLQSLGIDAIWLPPCIKNDGPGTGYSPFDHYDLGDKYQKGFLRTALGTKDELLRMIAVLHANGIDVIQDAVLQHMSGAGSANGAGGQDPFGLSPRSAGGWKNFRYACYRKPATDESAADYLSRSGRWPKNWEDFYPNQFNNHAGTGDWDDTAFGPAISYDSTAYGQSSNAVYNPVQSVSYMRAGARDWMVWFKKQTGADGFRLDAAKNYPYWVQQDLLWNVKYNAGWANGGANMFAVGEVVGSVTDEDTWIRNVTAGNGGSEELAGTFDYGFRTELKNMVSQGGYYDLGSLPGKQQNDRFRTVPFVNNHDTYRPILDTLGNITGWDTHDELGGGHIDSDDPRLSAAYAIAFAVDGSPQVYFEDLFDLENTRQRYTHLPYSVTGLPVRDDIANIIWCHQRLTFKKGAYKVRWQAPDLLIIERGYNGGPENSYALIGVNDNYTTWQSATVQTDFGPNVALHDYSGANSLDIRTDGTGKATLFVPPCNGSNKRRGYCIWGPAGITGDFQLAARSTTQEWELSDDLGDAHDSSLQEGGALPEGSIAERLAGRIYAGEGRPITVNVYPVDSLQDITVTLYDSAGSRMVFTHGKGSLTANYSPAVTGWYMVKVRNTGSSDLGQTVYVKVTYTAPGVVK